jgi:hypothetical protein
VEGPAPRRDCVESGNVFVVENLLTIELKAAHATRLKFYKDKEINFTAVLAQAAEHNDHQLYQSVRISIRIYLILPARLIDATSILPM